MLAPRGTPGQQGAPRSSADRRSRLCCAEHPVPAWHPAIQERGWHCLMGLCPVSGGPWGGDAPTWILPPAFVELTMAPWTPEPTPRSAGPLPGAVTLLLSWDVSVLQWGPDGTWTLGAGGSAHMGTRVCKASSGAIKSCSERGMAGLQPGSLHCPVLMPPPEVLSPVLAFQVTGSCIYQGRKMARSI